MSITLSRETYNRELKNSLTSNALSFIINVTRYKGVEIIAEKSRAEYMKSRRESRKTFSVVLDREKLERFENRLLEQNRTKTQWLNEKIDEELGK